MTRGPLTNLSGEAHHIFAPWIGQRSATFRFELVNGTTGQFLGEITPIRDASLTHDTTRTIKRTLRLNLGKADTAAVNPVTDRVDLYMVFNQAEPHEHPLGRYMFTDAQLAKYTSGRLGSYALLDEMFIVDQQITAGIAGNATSASGNEKLVSTLIRETLGDVSTPVPYLLEASPYVSVESWGIGTGRGQVLESLALTGDYFSPYFGNDKHLHFIRSFDPARKVPDFDFDNSGNVSRDDIIEANDLLTAPNRFVVVSNTAQDPGTPVVGSADVPATAPHSITNRGFTIPLVVNLQVADNLQAAAVARNLAIRQDVFERVALVTAPDPRHDSYNVIRWQNQLWLELAWSVVLVEGAAMTHVLRRAYR